jgi:spore coat assembly protein SafA
MSENIERKDEKFVEKTEVAEVNQQPACPPGGILYTVRQGDTLSGIASRFGIPLDCLRRFNPQITGDLIFPGQVLCIPPASACVPTPTCPPGGILYTVRQGDTVFSIASRFGITADCLLRFNPQITDTLIIPGQVLCIPPASACVPTPTCPPGGILYTVRQGDTLSGIASRFGIPLDCLRRFNPQITGDLIFPGQVLCIPPASACVPTPTCPPGGILYTVRQGDTVFSIASRFGITADCLLRFNPQITDTLIIPGQVLCIPPASACVPTPVPCPPGGILYTIRAGDTLFNIANRYGIPLDCLIRFNPQITNPNLIFPGQVICIPPASACVPTTVPCPPGGILYTVRAGDTLFNIANRYGIPLDCLIRFNPQITNPNLIFPGQVICIPPASACR